MKALYFAKPLEYRVLIPAEQFVQGGTITGTLTVANRDQAAHDGLVLELGLAYGAFKELKQSGAAALTILERHPVASGLSLAPGAEETAEWRFDLAPDAPVKTKDAGPFLLYGGPLDDPGARGQIDLPIAVAPALETLIASLENYYAFEARSRRFADGFLEVRFKPPATYPTLEELVASMRLEAEVARVKFHAKVKSLRRGEAGGTQKRKLDVEKVVPLTEFLLSNALPNRALYKSLLGTVLSEIAPPPLHKG